MCTITIDPTSISTAPATAGYIVVTVSGTVANCLNNSVGVTIACPGSSTGTHVAAVTGTSWTASGDVKCQCGDPVTIVATCNDTPPCSANLTTPLVCKCCPTVHTNVVPQNLWNSSGQQLVTFVTTLTFPPGCSVTVQRNFGDGYWGPQQTFPNSQFPNSPVTYQETHAYSQAGYTSTLDVLSNSSCASSSDQVIVSTHPPFCATHPAWGPLCRVFRLLFLLSGVVAAVLFIASTSPNCVTASPPLVNIAAGFLLAAGVFFAVLYFVCRKCLCGFWEKLLGQLFVVVGMVLIMFILPGNCTQPFPPFANPSVVMWAVLVALAIGALALLYSAWWKQYKDICPLNNCDYWQAIKDALLLAIFAVLIVYFVLGAGVTPSHLGLALLAILASLLLTNHEIQINQNAGNC